MRTPPFGSIVPPPAPPLLERSPLSSSTAVIKSPSLLRPYTWTAGTTRPPDAPPAVVVAAVEGAAGVSRARSDEPSCGVDFHSCSPDVAWNARTVDCHTTTTAPPVMMAAGGAERAPEVPTAGMWASHVTPPVMLHRRTNAPRPLVETESSDLPNGCSTAMSSPSGSTVRQETSPERRSRPAMTPGSLATSARRC